MPTIELFGIIAEVPEGHEDFEVYPDGEAFFWLEGSGEPISNIFEAGYGMRNQAYRQRRVVDAARIYWIDKAVEQLRSHIDSWPGEEQVIGNIDAKKRHIDYWQQAENWRRIGEKAKEAASG